MGTWTKEIANQILDGTYLTVDSRGASKGAIMYAEFGITEGFAGSYDEDIHYALPYNGVTLASGFEDDLNLGSGDTPATSFTTAASSTNEASKLVNKLWYLPDDIYIDGIYSLEGRDSGGSSTHKWNLMAYDFTSGSTACLTNGEILASINTTNTGSAQPYLNSWTVNTPRVVAGKVIIATFLKPSDLSHNVTSLVKIKYHLT